MTKEIINDVKEILESLENCTIGEIEEFRKEWISSLEEPFEEFNIQFTNHVCDIAIRRMAAGCI